MDTDYGRYQNSTMNKLKNSRPPQNQPRTNKSSVQRIPKHIPEYYPSNSRQQSPQMQNINQLKAENTKLKKMLKQTQAKRIQITKQCSELANKYDKLEQQNMQLHRKIKDVKDMGDGQKFRYEQLKFLNKELNTEIQQLQRQNQNLSDKLKHHADILEKKYQDIQQRAYKRIQQALKRVKKAIHYLTSLSAKQIEKTKDIQIQNLRKTLEVLKGKYNEDNKFQEQIEELMNPIRNIQEDLHQKIKQMGLLKEENNRLQNEVKKHKKIQKQLLPQYKQAIQKLKKNLGQVRMQLSQNEYDKCQIKKKCQEKIKQVQIKYDQLFKQHRKLKLQNKIFEKKIQEMEDDVEQQKQRLMGQNQLLKKLYKSQDQDKDRRNIERDLNLQGYVDTYNDQQQLNRQNRTQAYSYKTTANNYRQPIGQLMDGQLAYGKQKYREIENSRQKGFRGGNNLKKNYSASQLRADKQKGYKNTIQTQKQKQTHRIKIQRQKQNIPNPMSNSRESESHSRKNYDHLRHTQDIGKNAQRMPKRTQKLQISDYYHHQQHDNDLQGHIDDKHEEDPSENHSQYKQQNSNSMMSVSQQGLKNQIFRIDQEIIEIQKTLDRQLNMYK